jgi:hypothetical protein
VGPALNLLRHLYLLSQLYLLHHLYLLRIRKVPLNMTIMLK